MSRRPKVSKMTLDELIVEDKGGCTGLRKTQVQPAIQTLAMKGDQEAIEHLGAQGVQCR